ncbi:hypothetical protein QBC37DRAFT_391694 [Rhypophila decipiens]|uniref:Nephrocystin 3-like N-terminal domain-containing protein n=1 Tax=Rhypophila decipiens TaxID=261697 RepID=A0AAN6XXN1_9PEZI|nr:hypothetical protein QBC37DRAFT_391694 [Rhypophila decipiens]
MSTSSRRLAGVLDTYLRKRLSRNIHPAITLVRDHGEETSTFLQPPGEEPQVTSSNAVVIRPEGDIVPAASTVMDAEDDESDEIDFDEIYRDAKREKQGFQLAMEAYETTVGSKFKTEVTDKPIHTWEDVLAEVDRAQSIYSDGSGAWGKIQKGLRRFGSNAKAFEAWAGLLPAETEYTSVLCGGLKLIFGAAARLHDLRSDIGDALAEIPDVLRTTHLAMGIFRRPKELHQASAALYTAIISAFTTLCFETLIKSIFKQESYAKHLDDLLQDLREKAERFHQAISLCSYGRIVETSYMVKAQGIQQAENHKVVIDSLDKYLDELRTFKGEFQTHAGAMQGGVGEVAELLTEILAAFLSSDSMMDPRTQDLRGPTLPIRRAKSESTLLRDVPAVQDKLMSALDYNSSADRDDMAACLRSVWQIPRSDQDRLVPAMQSPKLKQWITDTTSSAIFLNFNATRNRRSTSFVAAKLADSIQASSSVVVLSFFCDAHSRQLAGDSDLGVAGMMRSLVGQLLVAYPNYSVGVVQGIRAANLDSVKDLCKIFILLIGQLPRNMTVFCILDGVTRFEETNAFREEGEAVVKEMMRVVNWTAENGCCFKLLLTSPGNSRVLYRHLLEPEKDSIWLPAKVPSRGGFINGKWEGTVGRDMDRLGAF